MIFAESLFDRQRLLAHTQARLEGTAAQIKEGIIDDVRRFVGNGHLLDDVVLFVVLRE